MKTFLDIPLGSSFRYLNHTYTRISYERTQNLTTFNAVNIKGKLCFFEDDSKVIELETTHVEKKLTLKDIGFMEKFQFVSDKGKNLFYWKIDAPLSIGYNIVGKNGKLSDMPLNYEVELV